MSMQQRLTDTAASLYNGPVTVGAVVGACEVMQDAVKRLDELESELVTLREAYRERGGVLAV